MTVDEGKTLGQAIDEIIKALQPLNGESRITALKAASDHLKIQAQGFGFDSESSALDQVKEEPSTKQNKVIDIRTLKEQKSPSKVNEMAALVAYYLSETASQEERKNEVDVEDMEKYFKQASFRLPNKRMVLHNAKKAGYFEALGNGKFKLNPVGYNLVAHSLPKGDKKRVLQNRKRKTTRKSKRK
jgi:hypothetical protein